MKVIVEPEVLGEGVEAMGSVLLLREWGSGGMAWHKEVKKALKSYPIAVFEINDPNLVNSTGGEWLHEAWILNRIKEVSTVVMWMPSDMRFISMNTFFRAGFAMSTGKLIVGAGDNTPYRTSLENLCDGFATRLHSTLDQVIEALLERLKPFKPIEYAPPLVRWGTNYPTLEEEYPVIDPQRVKKDQHSRIDLFSFEPRAFANIAPAPQVKHWWYTTKLIPNTLPTITFGVRVRDSVDETESIYVGRYNLLPNKFLKFRLDDGNSKTNIAWDGYEIQVSVDRSSALNEIAEHDS